MGMAADSDFLEDLAIGIEEANVAGGLLYRHTDRLDVRRNADDRRQQQACMSVRALLCGDFGRPIRFGNIQPTWKRGELQLPISIGA